MTVCFLSRAIELSGLHCEPLTSTQKFRISPRVSYTHAKIRDISPGLLHPHKNSGYLLGSLTPTQDLSDITAGLLHPNSRHFHLRGLTTPFLLCPTYINYSSFPDLNYDSSLDVVPRQTQPTLTKSGECPYHEPTPDSTRCHRAPTLDSMRSPRGSTMSRISEICNSQSRPIKSTLTLHPREEHPHLASLKASTPKPNSVTQDALMNEYDASNSNATLVNKC